MTFTKKQFTATRSPFCEIKTLDNNITEFTRGPHSNDCYIIVFVTQGIGSHTNDFVTYEVRPFTAFFITPGQVQSWELSDETKGFAVLFTLSFYRMHMRGENIVDFPFFNTLKKPYCLYLNEHRATPISVIFQEMIREKNPDPKYGKDEILCNCLDILLIRLSREYQQNNTPRQTFTLTSQIRKLDTLINKHFRELKLPRDYADRMNITPKHLNDICKRALNKTISDLIHERQVLEAKRQLAYTDMTIKEIALNLAFSDRSYFIRFFKKRTGITPEQFRESRNIMLHNL